MAAVAQLLAHLHAAGGLQDQQHIRYQDCHSHWKLQRQLALKFCWCDCTMLSIALSTISFLKQQLKSKQAVAIASHRNLKAEKTSRSAIMREFHQGNDELAFSQADSTDLRQELRVTQVAAAAESASLRQELKDVKDVAGSDAVLHNTESASLKEEL